MVLLQAKGIHKTFNDFHCLKGVDLAVSEGEVVSIIGPSGSGKSTFLRIMTGLETADEGTISVDGRVGLVFQQFNLFPHWSVLKNVMGPQITVLKKSKEEAEKTAREILEKVDLSEKADAYPCELSGGQQQRVAIARTLALSPKVIFFDEPTSALDPELIGGILKLIKSLADQNMTMVIVTHEMNFAKAVSNKIVFLEKGVILAQGTPEEILVNPSNERIRSFISLVSREAEEESKNE